jgi:hypothetical protein
MKRKLKKHPFAKIPGVMLNYVKVMTSKGVVKLPDFIQVSDYLSEDPEDEDEGVSAVWKKEKWADVKVGQYLLLRNDDPIPADVVIISSSTDEGTCFVETKNLDGETNLKIKRGIESFKHVTTPADCARITGVIETQPPTEKMYEFLGVANFNDGLSLNFNFAQIPACLLISII